MVFTKATDYALKCLVMLARTSKERLSVHELSGSMGCSTTYLSKVLSKLTRAEIIDSKTGPGAGYRLNENARQTRLIKVIELFEERKPFSHCFFGWAECGDQNPCPFHYEYKKYRQNIEKAIRNKVLEEVVDDGWPQLVD